MGKKMMVGDEMKWNECKEIEVQLKILRFEGHKET